VWQVPALNASARSRSIPADRKYRRCDVVFTHFRQPVVTSMSFRRRTLKNLNDALPHAVAMLEKLAFCLKLRSARASF